MKRIGMAAAVLSLVVSACGGGAREAAPAPGDGPGPQLVVERFLQAANVNDLQTMTTLFGTAEKRIDQLEAPSMAHRRMYVLASLLRHDDFAIQGQQIVPGRMEDATEVVVRLRQGERQILVPHLVVRTKRGGWIIEKIDVEPLTQRARAR